MAGRIAEAVSSQLRLELEHPPAFSRADFIVSPSNAGAAAALDAWPDWIGGALTLVGPPGSGKTHLATVWAERAGAVALTPEALAVLDTATLGHQPVLLDRADAATDEALFHLINRAAAGDGSLLLVDRKRPSAWPSALPDLRSRLNALRVAEIGEPDDALLLAVLQKFFRERSITPVEDVLTYLVKRIERSVLQARAIADQLDREMDARQRPLTKALARSVLERAGATGDLFEDDDDAA